MSIKFRIIAMLLLGSQLAPAQEFARVKVLLQGRPIEQLAQLGIETDHGEHAPNRYLTTDLSLAEQAAVRQAGFPIEILIPDVQQWYVDQNMPGAAKPPSAPEQVVGCGGTNIDFGNYPVPANMQPGSMGGYYTYQEMLDILDDMKAKFPQFISARKNISDTLLTHDGNALQWVRISDNPEQDESEPEAMFTALHHAREPLGLTQLLRFMWYLMENYDTDERAKALIDHTELYFVPCINPDGYLYNQSTNPDGGGLWRKNRRNNGDGTFGVDLNRNYSYQWGINDVGSSPNPGSSTYRGPGPFSEPETRLMRDFCLQHQFVNTLNYHTFSNLMIYPYAYNNQIADPYLPHLASEMVAQNGYAAGTTGQTLGYGVNGNSDDWMFEEASIFAYTPEVGPPSLGFWPAANLIDSLAEGSQYSNFVMAMSILQLAIANDLGTPYLSAPTQMIPIEVVNYSNFTITSQVALQSLLPSQVTIATASLSVTLPALGRDTLWFEATLTPLATNLANSSFEVSVNNTYYTLRDTIQRQILRGNTVTYFEDNFANDQNLSGGWSLTTQKFVSPPYSVTDSPNGNYLPDALDFCVLPEITIPSNSIAPRLQFEAQWAIENNYDWVDLSALQQNGVSEALCGRYTNPGSENQTNGQPLWDATQTTWVTEEIDVEFLKGIPTTYVFSMHSDGAQEFDGFYFDNLRFTYIDTTSAVQEPFLEHLDVHIVPNPANDFVKVFWNAHLDVTGDARLIISNTLGQIATDTALPRTAGDFSTISISHLPTGAYFCHVQTGAGRSRAVRLVVF
jgi:carboxypeptidase T